jgi:hypothetical protein
MSKNMIIGGWIPRRGSIVYNHSTHYADRQGPRWPLNVALSQGGEPVWLNADPARLR